MNMSLPNETFYPVGSLDQFMIQVGRVIDLNGVEIAVFQTSDGNVFAIKNESPHPKGGPLAEGIVSGHYLYDPLHDWKIDLETGNVQAPDHGQVQVYPVKIEDGQVWVATSEFLTV
ncbi:nitrite reductase small subunit NirD [Paenibacillus anaericanus]|uniref:nitrite reductase small subunit NirD n=1 Tax=Paenibacillus anaericanus TaxID=170367 RepID=UPI003521905E